jgi:hypothetical protein
MHSNLDIKLNSVTVKHNGGNNKCQVIKDKFIKLETNTMKFQKGYYTSLFCINSKCDWSRYREVSFYIKNLSDTAIKINLFAILDNGEYIMLEEGEYIFLQKEKNNYMKAIDIQSEGFELNNDFEGRVHIPLKNFNFNKETFRKVISFGIQTTTKEDIIQKMEISNIQLISPQKSNIPKEILNLKIDGDKNVVKPIIGESIAQYKMITNCKEGSENTASFYLEEEVEGVSITKGGRLTVLANSIVKKINIKSVINDKFNFIFEINLSDSSILNLKDKEGLSLTVPKENEVRKVISSQELFNRTDTIILFRIIIILTVILLLTIYLLWRIKWKKENID